MWVIYKKYGNNCQKSVNTKLLMENIDSKSVYKQIDIEFKDFRWGELNFY